MNQGEIVIYQTPDGKTELNVNVGSDTVWLTQAQIAELFGTQRPAITTYSIVALKLLEIACSSGMGENAKFVSSFR